MYRDVMSGPGPYPRLHPVVKARATADQTGQRSIMARAMTEQQSTTHPAPVVRFAPSPTGYLHIGGARTALFNWLYAKAKGGTFLLRIEDTDRERNNEAAVSAILDGITWLELDWKGEAVSQFARAGRHREVAEALLARGAAYRCYLTADELAAMRAAAEAEKRPLTIHSPWRDRDASEAPAGRPFAIRLKAPRDGSTVVADRVQGTVTFPNKDLDDLIILRSDGNPTYNLAVVVDDHDMGVTHVIRGVDHLTNAARQTQIYQAMGWAVPVWAHVPLIHGADGAKLSKRHGAQGVEDYRSMGYLPVALRNYLVRLGWSHGDDEIMSTEQLVQWFDIDAINKSPARFDFKKLDDLNGHYIRNSTDDELLARVKEMLAHIDLAGLAKLEPDPKAPPRADAALARQVASVVPSVTSGDALAQRFAAAGWDRFAAAIPSLKERSKTLAELVSGALYMIAARPIALDDKASKLIDADARALLGKLAEVLKSAEAWTAPALEDAVRRFAEANELKLGKVAQPLRAALTGSTVSPPVFDVLAVLGEAESLARIADLANSA